MSMSKPATTASTTTPKGDGHSGVFSSKYRKNPQVAAAVIDAIEAWKKAPEFDNFDDDLCESLWSCLCDVSMEEMKKTIKASVKRETRKKAKFEVDEKVLPKPPRSGSDIFNKELTAKSKTTGTTLSLKVRQEQWTNLPQVEKDKYVKMCEDAKAHYAAEYEKLRQQAIASGDFPSDAPKKPMTTYFLFRAHMLNQLKPKYVLSDKQEKLSDDEKKKLRRENNNALNAEIKKRWESAKSSSDELYVKFEEQSTKSAVEYRAKLAEWKKSERERQTRKNGGDSSENSTEPQVSVVSTNTTPAQSAQPAQPAQPAQSAQEHTETTTSSNAEQQPVKTTVKAKQKAPKKEE